MIVYGRFLSPFVRRVLVWAALQGRAVEHRPIGVQGDEFEQLRALNGNARVPLVVLEDGAKLIDSWAITDWLESTAEPGKRLLPPHSAPADRMAAMQTLARAHSMAEKAVAFVYETTRRPEDKVWTDWADRLASQAAGALAQIEAHVPASGFLGGDAPNGADIAAVIAHDFAAFTQPALLEGRARRLSALAARAAELPAFAETHPARM